MKVHYNLGGGKTPCEAGARWDCAVITSNKDRAAVTCKSCKRSMLTQRL